VVVPRTARAYRPGKRTTDAEGRYSFREPPGAGRIRARRPRGRFTDHRLPGQGDRGGQEMAATADIKLKKYQESRRSADQRRVE